MIYLGNFVYRKIWDYNGLHTYGGICFTLASLSWSCHVSFVPSRSLWDPITLWMVLWNLNTMLRMWLYISQSSGWRFQIFFIFTPIWGNDAIWLMFFNHQLVILWQGDWISPKKCTIVYLLLPFWSTSNATFPKWKIFRSLREIHK